MKLFCKIFKNVVFVITIIVFILGLALVGPKFFGFTPFVSTSSSMEPTIPTGSIVYVNTNDTNVSANDIIMFKIAGIKKDKMVTHRAIEVSGDEIITKGDANEEADANSVNKSQVIGKYAYHIPQLGYIYDKFGYKSFIVIAAWIIILNGAAILLSYLFKDSEKPKESKDSGQKSMDKLSEASTNEVEQKN